MSKFRHAIFILFFSFSMLNQVNLFSQVKEYFITCDPDDFAYIYENWEEDIDIPITLTYNGITWTDTEMRIRGDGTRMYPKKSLKVRFNAEPFADGKETLNFNAEYEDKSYIRAYVASQVFNMTGQHCFVTEHARLYLNGEFLGLYNRTENMDEQFLQENGYDPQGNLFKATYDGACLSIYDSLSFWEQKSGTGNKEDLQQLISDINQVSIDEYHTFCANKFDYDQVINMIACNMALSNQSTYYHNYYLFHDINGTGKWEMLPWDLDKTLSIYAWRNHTYSSAPWAPDNPYLEKAILNPSTMADIKARANEIFGQVLNPSVFWPKIDSLVAVLQESVAQDTTDDIENVDEWLAQVEVEKNYISTFAGRLNWYFDHVQSSFTCQSTPLPVSSPVTFNWQPSVDPDGLPVTYRLKVTTGYEFEPELTQIFDDIQTTSFTVDLPEGEYKWRLISVDASEQEVEAFNSRNLLSVVHYEILPCTISENLTLTSENSPYLVACDVEVMPGVVLTIGEGVEIVFTDAWSIRVFGGIAAQGSAEKPVVFRPDVAIPGWDTLKMINATSPCTFNNVKFINGRLDGYYSDISLENVYQYNSNNLTWTDALVATFGGNISVNNSRFISNNTGEGLIFSLPASASVTNSYFYKTPDAVEFLHYNGGVVKNNVIINPADDGIDFDNVHNALISGNVIYAAYDCGITLDTCQGIVIEKNLVIGSNHGVNLKNNAHASLMNNTLDQNTTAIWLYEHPDHPGSGGGFIDVVNTIVTNTTGLVIDADAWSGYTINYSLCNTAVLGGTGNIYADPLFVSPADTLYQLQPTSPCVDSGDPESPPDPDDTRADMGAYYFNQGTYNVIFNEINYKSASNFDTEDWVELYNVDAQTADISNWIFKDEDDEHIFEFPYGTIIEPGQFLVLCSDAGLFAQQNPDVPNYVGSFPFGLSSGGELIRLYNATGMLVDSVVYDNEAPWPVEPNGQGPTLELKSPFYDNTLPENWCASANHGTPGRANSCVVYDVAENPNLPFEVEVFPNPASDFASLRISSNQVGLFSVKLLTTDGKNYDLGETWFSNPGIKIFQLTPLPIKGICLLRLTLQNETGNYSQTIKLLVNPGK